MATWISTFDGKPTGLVWCDEHRGHDAERLERHGYEPLHWLESTEYYVRDGARPGDGVRYGPYATTDEAMARIVRFRELCAWTPIHNAPWYILTVKTSVTLARPPNGPRETPRAERQRDGGL